MTYNEIDKLAQNPSSSLAKEVDLGTIYAYHALRGVYEMYRSGKKSREEAEKERRLIYNAYRRWERDMEQYTLACKERNQAMVRAGTLRAELIKTMPSRGAEFLLEIACECISEMVGEPTLINRYRKIYL